MPSVSDIKAGRAYVEIGTKDSQLIAGLASAARRLQAFGGAIRGIGLQMALPAAAIFGPLAGAGAAYARHGEELEKSSKRTGLSVEATSTLGYAAGQTGTEAESLTNGMAKMSRTLVEAAQGSGQAQRALAKLHLTTADLAHLSQEDRFKLIADRIAGIKDPAVQAAAAMGIFGRGGAELLPMLSQGAAGISAMQARARALGLQWSGEDAAAAAKFSRVLKDMWDVLSHGVDVIGSAVAPLLSRMAEVVTNVVIVTTRWIGQHRELIGTIAAVAAGVLIAGGALVVLGTAISAVGIVLGMVAAGFGIIVTAVGALLSPVGLIITAIVAAAGALIFFSDTGARITNAVVGFFKKIYDTITFVLNNTSSLSEAWGASMTIAGTYIMQAWTSVKGYLMSLWAGFRGFMSNLWDSIGADILGSMFKVVEVVTTLWARAASAINAIWDKVGDYILNIWNSSEAKRQAGNEVLTEFANEKGKDGQYKFDLYTQDDPDTMREYDQRRSAKYQQKMSETDPYLKDMRGKRDAQNQVELDAAVASAKKEFDEKSAYLDDLIAKQRAATDKQTAEEKAANDKQAADAADSFKQAREAYEAELKKRHDASGEKSLADQWKAVVGPVAGKFDFKVPTPGDFSEATAGAQAKAFGTFQTGGLFGIGGGGVAERIAKAAEETARNTRRGPGALSPNTSTGDNVFN